MGWNWVDWTVLVLVGLYVWQGWERNLMVMWADVVGWLAAFGFDNWKGAEVARWVTLQMGVDYSWAKYLVGLFLIMLIQQSIYWLGTSLSLKVERVYPAWQWQVMWGMLPSVVSGVMLLVFIVRAFAYFPVDYPLQDQLGASWVGGWIERKLW